MYINFVKIENYRNFQDIEVNLSKLSIIIGENNSGKTNFINALKLVLNNSDLEFSSKKLSHTDINLDAIKSFYQSLKNSEECKAPEVKITVRFDGISHDDISLAIVSKWLKSNETDGDVYEIQYIYRPTNETEFIEYCKEQIEKYDEDLTSFHYILPTEFYNYSIVSTNNYKQIPYTDLQNININNIYAERDGFSDSNTMKSNSIFTKLLEKNLTNIEKITISNHYNDFFAQIKKQKSFEKIFKQSEDFPNLKEFIELVDCIPNIPNLKNILSNITLSYGEEFLHQKGLGHRNLIYILLFYQYFKDNNQNFSINCIEEPEAHLSTNNLNFIIDYINKSIDKSNALFQAIITSHRPEVINKLKLNNVIVFSNNKCFSLRNADGNLVNYLAKRPNFDILKLLFSNKVILVEGTTEEMLINTYLSKQEELSNIDVLSIGQKGFKTFLDIWNLVNKDNSNKKIGVIRDFDNQKKAKKEHHKYDDNEKVFVRTTNDITLENDLVKQGENCKSIAQYFNIEENKDEIISFLKNSKAENMLNLCYALQDDKIKIDLPNHIKEILEKLK